MENLCIEHQLESDLSMEHAQIQRLRLNGTKVFWNVKPFTLSRTVLNLYFVCRM